MLYLPSLFPFLTLLNPILYLPSLFPFLSVVTITSLNPILYLPSLYWTPFYTYHHFTESRFILTITLQFQFSTYRYFSVLYIPSLYRSPVFLMITFRFTFCAYHSAPFAIMYILLLQGGWLHSHSRPVTPFLQCSTCGGPTRSRWSDHLLAFSIFRPWHSKKLVHQHS